MNKMLLLVALFLFFELANARCPSAGKWNSVQTTCFQMMKNISATVPWGLAQEGCISLDPRAHLPIFKDANSWKIFKQIIGSYKQKSGSSEPQPESVPVKYFPFGGYKAEDHWRWLDDTDVDFEMVTWQPSEPSGTAERPENCLGYDPDKEMGISDIPCDGNYIYLCQMDSEEEMPSDKNGNSQQMLMSSASDEITGDKGWTKVGEVYYNFQSDDVYSREDGLKKCQTLDPPSKLPEFHNLYDYESFTRYVESISALDHQNIILSVSRKNNDTTFTNEKLPLDFSNWAPNQPFEYETDSNCVVAIDLNGYKWEAVLCTTKGYIICQIDNRNVLYAITSLTTTKVAPPEQNSVIKQQVQDNKNFNTTNSNVAPKFFSRSMLILSLIFAASKFYT